MAPMSQGGAMPLGYTRSGSPIWPIAGGAPEGEGGDGSGGEGELDVEAAKAAMKVVDDLKQAGIENPTGLLDTVKNLREFEKGRKLPKPVEKELEELRTKLKAADDAKLSETDRLAKKVAELEQQGQASDQKARERIGRSALKASAAAAGAIYPDDIAVLVGSGTLEFDDDGEPTNADALVKALAESKPELFTKAKATSFDGGARGGSGGTKPGMEQLLREAAGH
jgi:hypothetical protein